VEDVIAWKRAQFVADLEILETNSAFSCALSIAFVLVLLPASLDELFDLPVRPFSYSLHRDDAHQKYQNDKNADAEEIEAHHRKGASWLRDHQDREHHNPEQRQVPHDPIYVTLVDVCELPWRDLDVLRQVVRNDVQPDPRNPSATPWVPETHRVCGGLHISDPSSVR
jgi:hypothetical protein